MFTALSLVSVLVYAFLSFGAVVAPSVMEAYNALSDKYADIMFALAMMLGAFSGKAFLVVAERKNMPMRMWSDWKENALMVFVYVMCTLMAGAYLYIGLLSGFFGYLEHGWIYAVFTSLLLLLFGGQMTYWALMCDRNRKAEK